MKKIRQYGDKVLEDKSEPVKNINGSTLKIIKELKNVLISKGIISDAELKEERVKINTKDKNKKWKKKIKLLKELQTTIFIL